jgi:hypothetical protein
MRPLLPGVMKMSKHIGIRALLAAVLATVLLSACQRTSHEHAEGQS